MSFLLPSLDGCPHLQLAPMEGVGDRAFRKAMASIGGFDEAIRDFLRVPSNAHVKSLAKVYEPDELSPIPIAAQIMGSDPDLMGDMARELEKMGALRIDVNCGCPSNTVTGRGAGSSLLKDPNILYEVVRATVLAVSIPVTVKMRTGYDDTSLFSENLLAVEQSGVKYVTIHGRTKADGYGPPARWDLIAHAKSLLKIPLIGNGDITSVQSALDMLKQTKCDGLMIGRGSIMNPFIFRQIRSHFSGLKDEPSTDELGAFLKVYLAEMPPSFPSKWKMNKFKQLLGFVFKSNVQLLEHRQSILSSSYEDPYLLLTKAETLLEKYWR